MTPAEREVLATLKELVTLKLNGAHIPLEMVDAMPWETRPVYAFGANLTGHMVTMLADALELKPAALWARILVTSAVLGLEGSL